MMKTPSSFIVLKGFISKDKNLAKAIVAFVFALLLFLIPVKIGVGNNDDIPLIGSIEKVSQEQVDGTLLRAGSAYATLKAIQIAPKMFENVSVPLVGVKLGALLSPIVEQLDMLDSVLFYALLVAFGEKFLLGWITYVALHWLIPIGLLFYALGKVRIVQASFAMVGILGRFFIQFGLLAYLLLPTTAFINQSIYNAFNVDKKISAIQEQEKKIIQYQDEIERIKQEQKPKQTIKPIEKEVTQEEEEEFLKEITEPKKGFFESLWDDTKETASSVANGTQKAWSKTKEVASDVADEAKKLANSTFDALKSPKETIAKMCKTLNDALNRLMEMVAVFVITTIIVPIGVFFGFVAIFKQIYSPQIRGIAYEMQESIQKPSQKIKEIKERIQEGRDDE